MCDGSVFDLAALKRGLLKSVLVPVILCLALTGVAIWYIISHAPHPKSPKELTPVQQRVYYCPRVCAPAFNQCVDQCLININK